MASEKLHACCIMTAVVIVNSACEDPNVPDGEFPVPDSVGVLNNGGFEAGAGSAPSLWIRTVNPTTAQYVSFNWDSSERRSGNRSVSIAISADHPSQQNSYYWSQNHTTGYVLAGKYEIGGWVKTHNIRTSPSIEMTLWDAMTDEIVYQTRSRLASVTEGTSVWTFVSDTFTAHQRLTRVQIQAGLTAPANAGGTVWFDDLAITPIDLPPDTTTMDPAWAGWIRENAHPIVSLTSETYDDLQFLKPLIGERRLVQLGESAHGVGEYNAVKVRLIKFLHEEMGFDVVAFESELFGCFLTYERIDSLSAFETMASCISGLWWAEETLPLFEYIKETQMTDRPLVLAGLDMKPSSRHHLEQRPRFLRDVLTHIDSTYAIEVEELDTEFVNARLAGTDSETEFVNENATRLLVAYQALVDSLDLHMATLRAAYSDNPSTPLIARQVAWSAKRWIDTRLAESSCTGSTIRDSTMADNVDFLLNDLYPEQKIVSWAHNAHVRHNNAEVVNGWCFPNPTMGTFVSERHRSELYTVGLYMYEGRAVLHRYLVFTVDRHASRSVEQILHTTGHQYAFIDMLHREEELGNSWMFQSVEVMFRGKWTNYLVPRDQYDAILYIEEVHPPTYIY